MSSLNVAFLRERLEEMASQVLAERSALIRDQSQDIYPRFELLAAVEDALVSAQSSLRALAAVDQATASQVSGPAAVIIEGQQALIRRMSQERRDAIGGRR